MEKLIITAAITGGRITREMTPHIPITPEEIVQSAYECWQAGAAIVHIHVRDPKTALGTQDVEIFRRVVEPLREKTDLLLCLTTGGTPGRNLSTDERLAPVDLNPELASFDAGSFNRGRGVYINSPEFLDRAAEKMRENGVKPEFETFDLGMIMTTLRMRDQGKLDEPLHFQFVLGTPWGAPATPKSLLHLLEHIPPLSTWSIIGAGRWQLPMSMMALVMGGHIRVGLEDSLYYSKGVLAETNAQFVERIVRISRESGREIATPDETREILSLNTLKRKRRF
ncbi:MAG: 3-keto-5-aminohexanoate cleavage protein [Desulfobacterales bacterium]|nr:MAG: 3-keto-5-aminohexanoate cleavage protein [Desulfobacterales bacterium]